VAVTRAVHSGVLVRSLWRMTSESLRREVPASSAILMATGHLAQRLVEIKRTSQALPIHLFRCGCASYPTCFPFPFYPPQATASAVPTCYFSVPVAYPFHMFCGSSAVRFWFDLLRIGQLVLASPGWSCRWFPGSLK
jgi:hypothetical protein